MKKSKGIQTACILIIIIFSPCCVNLKSVSLFSKSATDQVKKFEDINYNFAEHCADRCYFQAIMQNDIERDLNCECSIYTQADSVTQRIYNAIQGYFQGLTNLSKDDLTSYNIDTLKNSLTEGNFEGIQIGKDQVNAYGTISKLLLRAITDKYRDHNIKSYIKQANQPIQILLTEFQFIMRSNLEGVLNFKKEKIYTFYTSMINSGTLSNFEKGETTKNYYQELSIINAQLSKIDKFAEGLKTVADGHQRLYDNLNTISTNETRQIFLQYASDIQNIISEFNK